MSFRPSEAEGRARGEISRATLQIHLFRTMPPRRYGEVSAHESVQTEGAKYLLFITRCHPERREGSHCPTATELGQRCFSTRALFLIAPYHIGALLSMTMRREGRSPHPARFLRAATAHSAAALVSHLVRVQRNCSCSKRKRRLRLPEMTLLF